MTTTPLRLAMTFLPSTPPERLKALAQATEAAGLDELWLWEDCFKEAGIAAATAALAWTERIRVGVGLLPVPLRNVALTAMEIATVERLFPGRFVPGIGHGVQSWMAQTGTRVDSPMTLLREYTDALRALLNGERVTVAGRYVILDDVALDWPPLQAPPLVLGGEKPKTLALAGELGDGTVFTGGLTDDEVAAVIAASGAGRAGGAGASSRPHELIVFQMTATGPGAQARLESDLAEWDKKPDPTRGVAGDAATIAASLRRLAGLGITTVAIQPTQGEPDLEGLIAFIGQEVRPLL
jgi:alkanesulfonate monooxygenase SsuD/methylene tetrahydromethanopterin reductase-like flavin-dependent oxidoreductase (luciferase family)